jgi:hypothetical protein
MDNTKLSLNYKSFVNLLNTIFFEYLLVGGFAVGYYGYKRSTRDLDLWIPTSPSNSEKSLEICRTFVRGLEDLTVDAFCTNTALSALIFHHTASKFQSQ